MRRTFAALLGAAGTVGLVANAVAATNGLDAAFGTGGFVPIGPAPSTGYVFALSRGLAIASDGGILLGGHVSVSEFPGPGAPLAAIGKLHADGSWDETFGDHGIYLLPHATAAAPNGGDVHNILVLSDHSIVAAGGAYVDNDIEYTTCTLLFKLSAGGTPDSTFAPDHSGSFCFDFAANTNNYTWFQHNEGIVAGTDDSLYLTTPYTNLTHGAVAHFDSSGALIDGYGDNGVAALPDNVVATRLQLTAADQILTMGGIDNATSIAVVRLDDSGQIDSAYGSGGMITFDAQPGGLVSPSQALLDAQQRLVIADNDENGGLLYYRFARLTSGGALDTSFNGSSQQPGFPGLAAPVLTDDGYFDGLVAAIPLMDGHILGIGDAGFAVDGDGATNLALVRLGDDSSYDASFGDAAHPGWASLNIGGGANGFTRARAAVSDADGHVFVTIGANDGNLHGCNGILRLIADRVFDDRFEAPPVAPACPP